MTVVNTKNQCFVVRNDELERRFDAFYYKPEFKELEKKINKLNYKKIKDIAFDLKNGSTPKGGIFQKKGIPYFRSQDFNLFDFEINQFIGEEFHKKLNRSAIKPKDVLLAVVGATLGVVGYVPENIKEGNINQNVVRIRVKDKNINPKYLAIILASEIGQKSIFRNATIQTQSYLNNYQLSNIKIPIPDKKTQEKIIQLMESAYNQKHQKKQQAEEIINSIDNYVLDELRIEIPEIKDKICFSMDSNEMTNRLDSHYHQPKFQEIENAFKKGGYKTVEFGSIIKNINYGTIPKEYSDTGIPLLKIGNLKPNEITTTELSYIPDFPKERDKEKITQQGDLLISQLGTVGITAPITEREKGFLYGSFILRLQISKGNPMYFSIILNSPIGKIQFQRDMTTATVRANTSIPAVKSLKIPLPPLEVQNKIAEKVKNIIENAKKLKFEAKNVIENAKKEVEKIILGKTL
jgi:restriction endonuclease S subunit